ncbi:MAG: virulence factor Mce family protein [uncultured Solirubrobacteraceae bacterium]|uniref:Virulence factor Mce family protein n=1 Tax=uncultured Solirubrobacteraceae bacterium TaxID=1162706 RepID=A0A6J4TIC7_9ACTN|nr:MAG: virulence factor Mce family protein [uncultured Solirubrobacteraceae bacterium]
MQKQAPTLGRMFVMVGFALSCFGLLLFLWLAFGGAVPLKPKGYQVSVSFQEGTQLAVEADVRINGVPVGKVKTVKPNAKSGRSDALIEMESAYAPLPKDVKAILRQKTLLGETYVELTPGTRSGEKIPEGGKIANAQVSPTVELDEIFRAFDPKTRKAFQTWMQSQSTAISGRAQDINDALGNLEPLAEDANVLLRILNSQEGAVRQVVGDTGEVFDALSERRGQLQAAIRNSNTVFETTARRDDSLRELFTVLPTFNREATTTVNRLTEFARDTDPLVSQLRPAAREFSPTFQELERLAPDLKALFRDLDPLITASKTGLPATRRFLADLRPFLGEFDPTLKQLNPILNMLSNYRDELRAFFANVPASTQATTPDGVHYLRTTNPQNPENLAVYPRRIGSNRTNVMTKPRFYDDIDRGLDSFETRHCRQGNPSTADAQELAKTLTDQLPILQNPPPSGPPNPLQPPPPTGPSLAGNILAFVFANAGRDVPAPPCREQPPYRVAEGKYVPAGGELTKYPKVRPAASSTRNP